MKAVLLRKSDDLNGATRNYFERLKTWMKAEDKNTFTNVSARQALRVNSSNQKRYMTALQEWGLVQKVKGNKKNGYAYEVKSFEDQEERDKRIQTVMDEIVTRIEKSKKTKRSSKA